VIGGGSSALETATLLSEHGGDVQVLARHDVWFGGRTPPDAERSLLEKVKLPVTSLGHGRENWVLQHVPWLMHYVPSSKRLPFTRRHLGPAPAWWLSERAEGKFPIRSGTEVVAASMVDGRVELVIDGADGRIEETFDRVVLGTGYAFDVDRIEFLSPEVRRRLDRHELSPKLDRHFESTVPGLYFVGPVAAESFGPLVRFVTGGEFAVPRVAKHLARRSRTGRAPRAARS
jgi:cation diffusion facilitator CzcD-associated flavoprotein CzcO